MKMEKMMEKFRLVAAATLAVALLGQVDSVYGSAPTPKPKFDQCIEACVTHYANKKVGNPAFKGDFIYDFLSEKPGVWSDDDIKQRFRQLEDSQTNKSVVYAWSKWFVEQAAHGVNAAITTISPESDSSESINANLGSCHDMCTTQLWKFNSDNIRRRDQAPPMPGAGREEAAAPAPETLPSEGQEATGAQGGSLGAADPAAPLAVPRTPGSVPPPPPPLPKVSPGEGNVAGSSGGGGGGAPPPPSTGEEPRQVDPAITEKLRSDLEAHRAARAKKDEEASSSDSSELDF